MFHKLTKNSVFANGALHSLTLGIGMLLVLGFIPLLFANFSQVEVGIYFFLNTLSFAWIFVDLGIPQAIVRTSAKFETDDIIERTKYLITSIYALIVLSIVITSILYYSIEVIVIMLNIEYSIEVIKRGLIAISLLHSTSVLNLAISAFHRSQQNFRIQALINIVTPVRLYVIIGVAYVSKISLVESIMIGGVISLCFTLAILSYTIEKVSDILCFRVSHFRELINHSKFYMVTNLNISLMTVIVRYFTLSFAGLETFGVFSAIHSVYSKVVQVCEALGEVLFSVVSRERSISAGIELLKNVFLINFSIALIVAIFGIIAFRFINTFNSDLIVITFLMALPFGVVQSPIKHYLNATNRSYVNSMIYFTINLFVVSVLYLGALYGLLTITFICVAFLVAQAVITGTLLLNLWSRL